MRLAVTQKHKPIMHNQRCAGRCENFTTSTYSIYKVPQCFLQCSKTHIGTFTSFPIFVIHRCAAVSSLRRIDRQNISATRRPASRCRTTLHRQIAVFWRCGYARFMYLLLALLHDLRFILYTPFFFMLLSVWALLYCLFLILFDN